jgi:hypothetical protein
MNEFLRGPAERGGQSGFKPEVHVLAHIIRESCPQDDFFVTAKGCTTRKEFG